VDFIHQTNVHGIRQMAMKARSLIDNMNLTFISLTAMAIRRCLSAWKTGDCRGPPEFGPVGGAQCKCNTTNINHAVNIAYTDVFCSLDTDLCSASPEVQAKLIDHIHHMIHQWIHSADTDPAMAQPPNDVFNFDENFLHYITEEPIEQLNNSFNC